MTKNTEGYQTIQNLIAAIDIHMSSGFPIHQILYRARNQAVDYLANSLDPGQIGNLPPLTEFEKMFSSVPGWLMKDPNCETK